MPAIFAGIDGGQTSTVAVVADANGTLLGRGTAGPSDHVDEPANSQRAAQACEGALAAALVEAGLARDAPLTAVVVGLSGYEGTWHGREPHFSSPIVRYKHDSVIALAGAIRERPAAVVIAGTGSAGYGESANRDPIRWGASDFFSAMRAAASRLRAPRWRRPCG